MAQDEKSGIVASSLTLCKFFLGASMLTMPAAFEHFHGSPLWGFLFFAVFGIMTAGSFMLIGQCCESTGAKSLRELWSRATGGRWVQAIDVSIILNNFIVLTAWQGVTGDFLSRAAAGTLGPDSRFAKKQPDVALVTMVVLLPLSRFKSLAALKFTSLVGTAAQLYTWGFVCLAAWRNPIYHLEGHQSFKLRTLLDPDILKALSIFGGSSFCVHYNAPMFYSELENRTNLRFGIVTAIGWAFSLFVNISFAVGGIALFGHKVQGNILDGFTGSELSLELAWAFIAVSVTLSYPILYNTLRVSVVGTLISYQNADVPPVDLKRKTSKELDLSFELKKEFEMENLISKPIPKPEVNDSWFGTVEDPRNIYVDAPIIMATAILGVVMTDLHWIIALKGCLIGSAHTLIIPAYVALSLPGVKCHVRFFASLCLVLGILCTIFGLLSVFGLLDKFVIAEERKVVAEERKALHVMGVVEHAVWGQGTSGPVRPVIHHET